MWRGDFAWGRAAAPGARRTGALRPSTAAPPGAPEALLWAEAAGLLVGACLSDAYGRSVAPAVPRLPRARASAITRGDSRCGRTQMATLRRRVPEQCPRGCRPCGTTPRHARGNAGGRGGTLWGRKLRGHQRARVSQASGAGSCRPARLLRPAPAAAVRHGATRWAHAAPTLRRRASERRRQSATRQSYGSAVTGGRRQAWRHPVGINGTSTSWARLSGTGGGGAPPGGLVPHPRAGHIRETFLS